MNIKNIESQFDLLEKRAKRVAEYFNPMIRSPRESSYITDLQNDYSEDQELNSGDRYIIKKSRVQASSQPPALNFTDFCVMSKTKVKKSYRKPKRKEVKLESMQEMKNHLSYKGNFSTTKLSPEKTSIDTVLSKPSKQNFSSLSNSATFDQPVPTVMSTDYTLDLDLKEVKIYPENISSDYIRQSFIEISKFSSKNKKYHLLPHKENESLSQKSFSVPLDMNIQYQKDPNIEIKANKGLFHVRVIEISSLMSRDFYDLNAENGFILFKNTKKLDLEKEFGCVNGKTFCVTAKNADKTIVFYVVFKKYSKEVEENTVQSIKKFEEMREIKHFTKIKLPKINEAEVSHKDFLVDFKHPITEALVKFRDRGKLYKPQSYLAKLSLFEGHAYIRRRFSKA